MSTNINKLLNEFDDIELFKLLGTQKRRWVWSKNDSLGENYRPQTNNIVEVISIRSSTLNILSQKKYFVKLDQGHILTYAMYHHRETIKSILLIVMQKRKKI